jgi:hypothetical protein
MEQTLPDKIEDLISAARSFCRLSENETNRPSGSLERAAHYATIAQAHATTAQAMILHNSFVRVDTGA